MAGAASIPSHYVFQTESTGQKIHSRLRVAWSFLSPAETELPATATSQPRIRYGLTRVRAMGQMQPHGRSANATSASK